MISARRVQSRLLGVLGVTGCLAAAAAPLAAPVRADMRANAFLMALSDAGITFPHPDSATALGQAVCPLLIAPGGSFESVAAEMTDRSGLPYNSAGLFTVVAVATYCPAMMAPLLQNQLTAY